LFLLLLVFQFNSASFSARTPLLAPLGTFCATGLFGRGVVHCSPTFRDDVAHFLPPGLGKKPFVLCLSFVPRLSPLRIFFSSSGPLHCKRWRLPLEFRRWFECVCVVFWGRRSFSPRFGLCFSNFFCIQRQGRGRFSLMGVFFYFSQFSRFFRGWFSEWHFFFVVKRFFPFLWTLGCVCVFCALFFILKFCLTNSCLFFHIQPCFLTYPSIPGLFFLAIWRRLFYLRDLSSAAKILLCSYRFVRADGPPSSSFPFSRPFRNPQSPAFSRSMNFSSGPPFCAPFFVEGAKA